MNIKKIIRVIILCVTVILVIAGISIGVFAYKNKITTLEEAKIYAESMFNAEKNEVLNKLSDYKFNDILTEIKQIENSKNANADKLSYYHIALADKMSSASKKQITSAILDKSLSTESRSTIIISAQANDIILDYEQLSDAISDDAYEDIRPLLIELVADATPDNIDEIEKIVDNKTKGFSKAIETLWNIKPTKAEAVADEVFAAYSGEYDEIFRGAFNIKYLQVVNDTTDKNCAEFVALVDKILNTPCDDYEGRQIYIITLMEKVPNKAILVYFKTKGFEDELDGSDLSVSLSKLLQEPACVENIELVLHFCPYTYHNVWEAIDSHIKNNEEFFNNNSELKNKLEQTGIENHEIYARIFETE